MDEPIDLDARRKERKLKKFLCSECEFMIFHLFDDGSVFCANCETEAENLAVREISQP